MSQLFAWGAQSTGVSVSASFLPKKSQGWSPSEWTGWISLHSKGLWKSSPTPQCKSINSSALSLLISFRMDWLDRYAVHGTIKSLFQHHSSKASILWCLAFFTVQLSHPYMTTGKNIALTRWTFVGKVVSLLLNMLSRLVITFLPRSKCLLISWLQSPSAMILEPPQNKVWHCFHCFPIYFPWSDGMRCHDLRFLNVEL